MPEGGCCHKVAEESLSKTRDERQEMASKKKAERAAAEKERLRRLPPEARAKAQEKQERLQQRKNARQKMKMMKM